MFCPNCKYEYKPGIKKCPDCGADLLEKLEEPKPTVKKELRWAFLCTTQNLVYANFIKETLENNDIPCLLKHEKLTVLYSLRPVEVYVPEDKYEESLKIKKQLVDDL